MLPIKEKLPDHLDLKQTSNCPVTLDTGPGLEASYKTNHVSTDRPVTWVNILGSGEDINLTECQRRNVRRRKRKRQLRDQELAEASTASSGGAKKRLLSEPSNELTSKKSRRECTPPKTYAEKVKLIRMAVVKETFPQRRINEKDSKRVQLHLLGLISKMPSSMHLPMIKSIYPQSGALIVNCEDAFTTNWLEKALDGNHIILGIKLKVLSADNLPKLVKMCFRTKDTIIQDGELLLKILQKYHPTYQTRNWRIIHKYKETHSNRWIIEMDERSAKAIEEAGCIGRTGLNRGHFKCLVNPVQRIPQSGSGERSASTLTATVTTATVTNLVPSNEVAS